MTFDLDAFVREANGATEPFRFTWGGQEFTWPATLDLRAEMALSEGRLWDALRLLCGEHYERFLEVGEGFDINAVRALFAAHAAHVGSSLGESSASAGSSPSTQRPSKRTSKSTTTSL